MTGLKKPIDDHLPLVYFFLILFHYLGNAGEEDKDSSEDDTDEEPQRVTNYFSFPANSNCSFIVRSEDIKYTYTQSSLPTCCTLVMNVYR